jgi:diguanylate cyclase (GGDEF)-like protein
MADLDYFKRVNDTYGHQAGDVVLSEVARIMRASVRQHDEVGRYGGEEFMVVLPDTGPSAAMDIAERMRMSVESTEMKAEGASLRLTISLGVSIRQGDESAHDLMADSDKALYAAKAAGRNCVRVAGGPTD